MNLKIKTLTLALLGMTAAMTQAAGHLGPYSPVTDQRLQNPEPKNWLMYRGNYSGWGYSALEQINTGNVKKLKLAWSSATGVTEGHQSPPIVNNGYMYVTTPNAQVIALNAKTGQEIWRSKKEIPADLLMLHNTNRGVALYGDKVYVATVDSHLIALDAVSGKVIWDKAVGDVRRRRSNDCNANCDSLRIVAEVHH
jgi:alcohol dehydrogenase (cytochrome c)